MPTQKTLLRTPDFKLCSAFIKEEFSEKYTLVLLN